MWHGRPVYFSLSGPWNRSARMSTSEPGGTGQLVAKILIAFILFAPLLAAIFLARWNFVRGKGDRSGAMRLAIAMFSLHLVLWVFQAHYASVGDFVYLLALAISTSLFWAGLVWMLYLALEPYVRRYWPQAIISWTRVLSGRWRDPLVGRDVLYGAVLGIFFCDIFVLRYHLEALLGAPPASLSTDYLVNARSAISAWLWHVPGSISSTLLMFLLLFLFRVLLRKSWLAAIGFVLLFTTLKSVSSNYPAVEWPLEAILYITVAFGALRFGLVALDRGSLHRRLDAEHPSHAEPIGLVLHEHDPGTSNRCSSRHLGLLHRASRRSPVEDRSPHPVRRTLIPPPDVCR